MQLAFGDRIQNRWKSLHQLCRASAARGGILREPKLVNAVRVEARAAARPVEAPRINLCEVLEQRREHLIGLSYQLTRPRQKRFVRDMRQAVTRARNEPHDAF
jgi:hypothetical protein